MSGGRLSDSWRSGDEDSSVRSHCVRSGMLEAGFERFRPVVSKVVRMNLEAGREKRTGDRRSRAPTYQASSHFDSFSIDPLFPQISLSEVGAYLVVQSWVR